MKSEEREERERDVWWMGWVVSSLVELMLPRYLKAAAPGTVHYRAGKH